MYAEARLTEDGRLFCTNPHCDNVELHYHQTYHRRDAYMARFDKKNDTLYMMGDPLLKGSDTLQVYDEYLFCPYCGTRHDAPWDEDGDRDQEQLQHEGDFLREIKPETPAHECPKCGNTSRIKHVEDYQISRDVRTPDDDFEDIAENDEEMLIVEGDNKIEYDGGGENERLECYSCHCIWSIQHKTRISYE